MDRKLRRRRMELLPDPVALWSVCCTIYDDVLSVNNQALAVLFKKQEKGSAKAVPSPASACYARFYSPAVPSFLCSVMPTFPSAPQHNDTTRLQNLGSNPAAHRGLQSAGSRERCTAISLGLSFLPLSLSFLTVSLYSLTSPPLLVNRTNPSAPPLAARCFLPPIPSQQPLFSSSLP